jgi:hypothetical protein
MVARRLDPCMEQRTENKEQEKHSHQYVRWFFARLFGRTVISSSWLTLYYIFLITSINTSKDVVIMHIYSSCAPELAAVGCLPPSAISARIESELAFVSALKYGWQAGSPCLKYDGPPSIKSVSHRPLRQPICY